MCNWRKFTYSPSLPFNFSSMGFSSLTSLSCVRATWSQGTSSIHSFIIYVWYDIKCQNRVMCTQNRFLNLTFLDCKSKKRPRQTSIAREYRFMLCVCDSRQKKHDFFLYKYRFRWCKQFFLCATSIRFEPSSNRHFTPSMNYEVNRTKTFIPMSYSTCIRSKHERVFDYFFLLLLSFHSLNVDFTTFGISKQSEYYDLLLCLKVK